ncbi:MAG: gliding motility-associated C-terminal domain-containing protein [Crocinitomicaceae bacterium]|nr:gliding motility-associated C-terminal domain-containing protein [Crocinitomicaceae bacterium]
MNAEYISRKIRLVTGFKIISLFLLLNSYTSSNAQQDTIFWFAAPEISSAVGDNPIHLRLTTYSQAATVTISQPANGGFTPIVVNIPANSVQSVDLSSFLADIESPSANAINSNGLKIVSTEIISAYYELSAPSNKEIFSLKGNKALGMNFYTPFQKQWNNASISPSTFSSIEIVATQNNTTVVITPKTNIVGHTVGSTFNITLDEGETYSARDVNLSATTSLAGSIVASDKPVAVTLFSGALMNGGCTSSMGDQITPTEYLGTDFIIHKGTSSDDRFYILATQNSTSITIENMSTTTSLINWSETYEYDMTDTYNYVHTSKPVYLWHASGYGCNLSGAQLPPVFCAGKYEQTFTRSSSDSLGVILYTRAGFEGDFELNGNPSLITAGGFTVVPGTSGEFVMGTFYFNTTDVPVGSYNIVTNSGDIFGLGILNGQSTAGSGYAYLSEFASYPFVDAGLDATICQNVPFDLNGIVGGGTVTGTWSGTGFGSFSLPFDSLNNTYNASVVDTIISPINLILTSTGPCPVQKDTLVLTVTPAPIVNAGADQIVCGNNATVTLNGNVTGGTTTGMWSSLGTGTFSPSNTDLNAAYIPSNADTAAGVVYLVLASTGSASCNANTDTMKVVITDAPFVDAGAPSLSVCSNNPNFSLNGTVYGGTTTGKWTTSGNGLFSPDNLTLNCSYQPSPTDVSGGSIWIYLTSTNNGLCYSAKDSVQVFFTSPPIVDAGGNMYACTNEPAIDLSGSVSGPTTTGTWSGGAGTFTPDNNTLTAGYVPTASEILSGSVNLILTSTNNGNCLAVNDQVTLTFVAPPTANFSYTDACENDTIFLNDFSLNGFGSIVSWHYDLADGDSAITPNASHIYSTNGTYDVILTIESSAGCVDKDTNTVTVFDNPISSFSYTSSCDNDLVVISFTDQSTVGNGTINYWYYDFGGMGSQAVQNPSHLFTGYGNFTITQIVKTTDGCSDTSIQILPIPPSPEAGFFWSSNNGLNVGAEFTFIDTSNNAVSWYWDLGNGSTSTDSIPETVYFANGDYDVTLWATSSIGCVDSITRTITISTVTNEITQLIPNAISPNGDGKNDWWKLDFIPLAYPDAQVVIVNRWGQTIYESIGYSNPWDGTFNGELVPEGNYYYIIKLSEDEIYQGALLVLISND